MTHVVVVGGGIAGLAAAYELTGGAVASSSSPSVTVLEAAELGGKLRAVTVGDGVVDVGPDGFLVRRPEAVSLVNELGASTRLAPVAEQGAWVLARGRLRRLPSGLALGVPTRLGALEAVRMLGVRGALRAGVDLVAPRRASRSPLPDRAIGPLVSDKLGRRVVDVLVDPLVGGIHAGRVRDLSAAAVFPPLLAAGQGRGSLMRALRTSGGDAQAAAGPAFMTLLGGVGTLPGLLAEVLVARGARCEAGTAVVGLHRGAPGAPRWVVETTSGAFLADAVVLGAPAAATAALLSPLDAGTAALVGGIDAASVAVVTLRLAHDDLALPDGGTGVLVPAIARGRDGAFLTTAVSFLDRKWPHLLRDGERLVRASIGRIDDRRGDELDDDDVVTRVGEELGALFGGSCTPRASHVARWPDSFPQYRVNHLVRVDGIETAVGALGGLAVAGAAYRGVGVPACIGSGRAAARAVRAWLVDQS